MKLILTNLLQKLSIKTKLITVVLILIIYPIIIIGYIGYRNYSGIMTQKAIDYNKISAERLIKLISERIDKIRNFSIQIFYDGRIYDFIRKIGMQDSDSFDVYILQQEMERHMTSLLLSKPELDMMMLSFKESDRLYTFDRYQRGKNQHIISIEGAYKTALSQKGKPVWYVEKSNDGSVNIFITKIILDISSLEEIGMLVLKIRSEYLFDNIYDFFPDNNQSVSILSGNNTTLFALNPINAWDFHPSELPVSEGSVNMSTISVKGDNIIAITSQISPLDWKLVLSLSSNTLLKEVRAASSIILLLCAITLPIGILLINIVYISVIRPLNILIKTMHMLEKGNIGATIKIKRMDEIGYLFRVFNKMSSEIENLINTVYKEQLAMKEAELKQLQAQITPHFLYNTLDAINWRAKISGVEEISEMVTALSCIIEANLNRSNQKFITIENEMKYIDNYILLVKKRFGSKISFNAYIEEGTLNHMLPKLIIQPIIENAIFHGLELKKGKGLVQLSIKFEQKDLVIRVSDDGIGIDEFTLEKINKELSSAKRNFTPDTSTSSKIGILNVHRRIQLLYGREYGVKISSQIAHGTEIEMRLPINGEKESVNYDESSDY